MDTYVLHELGCWSASTPGFSFGNLLGIINNSGYTVDVRSIQMTPTMGFSTGDQRPQQLYRISALAGGDALTPIQNDSNDSALPSQVLARTHGTVTTAGVLRQFGVLFGQRIVGAGNEFVLSRLPGWTARAMTLKKTNDQRVVLREGEGFAWVQDAAPTPRTQEGVFTVRDAASGACYTYRVPNVPAAEQDVMFALFNGVGSGVVLEVAIADCCDQGMQGYNNGNPWSSEMVNTMPGFRVVKCRDLEGGDLVTPYKRDSASPNLPSGILCYRGGRTTFENVSTQRAQTYYEWQAGAYSGQKLLDQQQLGLIRGMPRDPVEAWAVESTTFPHRMEGVVRDVIRSRSQQTFDGITLRRYEALAVAHWYRCQDSDGTAYGVPSYTESPNTGAKYNIEIEFNVSVGQGELLPYGPSAAGIYIS